MSDVIHATRRAFLVILNRLTRPDELGGPSFTYACGPKLPRHGVSPYDTFTDFAAFRLNDSKEVSRDYAVSMPTCAICRVLVDGALEGRDLREQLKAVSP